MDLDHFKSVNDSYGHPVGDCVLVAAANVIRSQVRDTDFVGRFGGEEFTILLPGTPIEGAKRVAEKIRRALLECSFEHPAETLKVTASFGVAALAVDGDATADTAYTRADEALYRAKGNGRNRVETAERVECVGARTGETISRSHGGFT